MQPSSQLLSVKGICWFENTPSHTTETVYHQLKKPVVLESSPIIPFLSVYYLRSVCCCCGHM